MMITYKTFTKPLDPAQNLPDQQEALREQLVTFINETAGIEEIVEISELAFPNQNQFSVTVWYKQLLAKPESAINLIPEAQSADVLTRSLREQGRRELMNTLVDEHLIRTNSG
jgi:hypothetical protein